MVSIDWLTFWFEANRDKLEKLGAEFSLFVKNTETNDPAQGFDIETKKYVARVTLWESGECNFDALGARPGGVNIYEHRTIHSEEDLNEFLMPLVSVL